MEIYRHYLYQFLADLEVTLVINDVSSGSLLIWYWNFCVKIQWLWKLFFSL